LNVVPIGLPARQEVPADLTPEQAKVWESIVSSKPVDWFAADSVPILTEYVRAAAMCNLLARQIEAAVAGGDAAEIKTALALRDVESRRAMSLATKLRLTPQARYTPKAADTANRKAGNGMKPWEVGKG
jgi:hypothetical protein